MSELDEILAPLQTSDSATRFAVLQALATYWCGAPGPQPAPPADLAIPDMLRRWYEWAGPVAPCMNHQNILRSWLPEPAWMRLEWTDGLLFFHMENQGCYFWATEPHGVDPPVFARESWTAPWEPQGCVLSEHLLASFIFEATLDPDACTGLSSVVDDGSLDKIVASMPTLPIPPWRWPAGLARFRAAQGVLMVAIGSPVSSIQVAAKEKRHLAALPGIDWDYRNF